MRVLLVAFVILVAAQVPVWAGDVDAVSLKTIAADKSLLPPGGQLTDFSKYPHTPSWLTGNPLIAAKPETVLRIVRDVLVKEPSFELSEIKEAIAVYMKSKDDASVILYGLRMAKEAQAKEAHDAIRERFKGQGERRVPLLVGKHLFLIGWKRRASTDGKIVANQLAIVLKQKALFPDVKIPLQPKAVAFKTLIAAKGFLPEQCSYAELAINEADKEGKVKEGAKPIHKNPFIVKNSTLVGYFSKMLLHPKSGVKAESITEMLFAMVSHGKGDPIAVRGWLLKDAKIAPKALEFFRLCQLSTKKEMHYFSTGKYLFHIEWPKKSAPQAKHLAKVICTAYGLEFKEGLFGTSEYKRLEVKLAAKDKKGKLGKFSDFLIDSYPTDQWYLDLDNSTDLKWVIYCKTPRTVLKFFEETAPEFGLKIDGVRIGLISPAQFEKIKKRIDEE